jgi:hypothetical protein
LSKAEGTDYLVQYFACWLGVLTVIKDLIQTCKQGETRNDDCEASQHGNSLQVEESIFPRALAGRAYTNLTSRQAVYSSARSWLTHLRLRAQ